MTKDTARRLSAAWDWVTAPDDLSVLAASQEPEVRTGVAHHPGAPPATLAELSVDANDYVRRGVAGNIQTPPSVLIDLAIDPVKMVRQEVPFNPNCPPMIKVYFRSGEYGGMTLKEFLEASK